MIYKYPEEFIVPVVYVQDIKDKAFYRCKKYESLHEDKLVIPHEDIDNSEVFVAEVDIYGTFTNKDKSYLKMDGAENIINGYVDQENLEDQNIKNILKDIDEDYANSETLKMKV